MPDGSVSRAWRRYSRPNVRGLILVVLVSSASVGWIVRSAQLQRESARLQRDAVAAIRNAGGSVAYSWVWTSETSTRAGRPLTPSWVSDSIGVDYFGDVTCVWLGTSSTATDAAVAAVGRLRQVQMLSLRWSSVSDAALAHLKGLNDLSELDLSDTSITDAGLIHLEGLTSLVSLEIRGTRITDDGLVHLKGLTNLQSLHVSHTRVTTAGNSQNSASRVRSNWLFRDEPLLYHTKRAGAALRETSRD